MIESSIEFGPKYLTDKYSIIYTLIKWKFKMKWLEISKSGKTSNFL